MHGSESNQDRHTSRVPIVRQTETEVPPPAKKRARIHAACERCKTRKIKCDEGYPACSNCQAARTTCVKESSQVGQHENSRALQERVRWLEEIVKERAADVDLMQGPRILPSPDAAAHHGTPMNRMSIGLQPQQNPTVDDTQRENLAHEIGLVSVIAGQDARYVGPSSGYSFAKLVLASAGQQRRKDRTTFTQGLQTTPPLNNEAFLISPAKLPSNMAQTLQLSAAYWENIHFQYPFLHRPTHKKLVEHMYSTNTPIPVARFQVYMVLAISATILSRRLKVPLSAEGYCASAMAYFEKIQIEGSLEGLQCLLLLQVYALNNPSIGLNVWYLNYQCIASVLDLGLQRNVRAGQNLSMLTQEMRTRIFWVVYSLDRTLATIMGRPIGVRDEACELRLPQDIDDDALSALEPRQRLENYTPSDITLAIHLIKLAQLNSEIKYIANSISRTAPPHSYPQVPDVLAWKDDVLRRLRHWKAEAPHYLGTQPYVAKIVEIKYHEVMMLLLRPSPAIAHPSHDSLKLCQDSALAMIRTFDELYHGNLLPYTWPTVHSVFLGTMTMLYCIWNIPSVSRKTKLETLMADLKSASCILSALGEHWVSAKRSRELLDELSTSTIRWLIDLELKQSASSVHTVSTTQGSQGAGVQDTASEANNDSTGTQNQLVEGQANTTSPPAFLDILLSSENSTSMLNFLDDTNQTFDIDAIMQGVFDDYQLDVEFGQSFPLGNGVFAA